MRAEPRVGKTPKDAEVGIIGKFLVTELIG